MKNWRWIMIGMVMTGSLNAQTLTQYQQEAATHNPALQARYKQFQAAMQLVARSGGLPDPNLSFGYFIVPIETRVGPQRARIFLSQMFPWFGTQKAMRETATLMAESEYQLFLDVRNQLYRDVAIAWYALYERERLEALERENQELLKIYQQLAASRLANGGKMVDVLRVEMQLNESLSDLKILQEETPSLTSRFNALLNRPDTQLVILEDSLISDFSDPQPVSREDLFAENPKLTAFDRKIQAAVSQRIVNSKQGLPKFGVGVDYVLVDQRSDMTVSGNGKNALMPMVTMSLPIYRKKYKAAIREAELQEERYVLEKEATSNMLVSSYQDVSYEQIRQQELMELCAEQIDFLKQSRDLLYSTYSSSGSEFEEVLRTQQQLLVYQKKQLQAQMAWLKAEAAMNYLISKNDFDE